MIARQTSPVAGSTSNRSGPAFLRIVIAMCLCVGLFAAPARAACPDGTPLVSGSMSRAFPDGANGGYVVWFASNHLNAQRVDNTGRVVSGWPAGGVQVTSQNLTTLEPSQFNATKDSNNRLVVVWATNATGTSKVKAQRITSAGALEWGVDGKNVITGTVWEERPAIAADAIGGVFIAFQVSQSGSPDACTQRFDTNGTPMLAAGKVVCNATGDQYEVRVAHTGNTFAVVCWTDRRNGINEDIYAQSLDSNLNTLMPTNGSVMIQGAGRQHNPVIAGANFGHAYIFCTDERAGVAGRADLYGQHIINNATANWAAGGRYIAGASPYFVTPTGIDAHTDNTKGVLVTLYLSNGGGGQYYLYAYRIYPDGQLYPNYNPAYAGLTHYKNDVSMIGDGQGGFISSWSDNRAGNMDVYAVKYLPGSGPASGWTANGTVLCAVTGNQTETSVTNAASGGALVTWTGSTGVVEQIVSSGGAISTVPPTPSGVAATDCPVGSAGVTVSWNDICGETEYRILRDGVQVGTVGTDVTSWLDPADGSPPPGNYTYCVRSYRVNGGESPGACDSGCMPVPPPPAGFTEQTLPTSAVSGLAFSPQQKPSVIYAAPSTNRPQYAVRANNTWTVSQIEDLPAYAIAVAIDAASNPHVIYLDRSGADPSLRPLRYAKRTGAGPWVPEPVDPTVQGFSPTTTSDLALDASGTPWVAYADDDGSIRVAWRGVSGGWTVEQAAVGGARGEEAVSLAISPAGNMVVSYYHSILQQFFCCIRLGTNNWTREPVDSSPNLSSIAGTVRINSSGQPVIAYFVPGTDQLKIATRTGTNVWSYQNVLGGLSPTTGVNPRLDIDAAGNLHVVYNNWGTQHKWYGKRTGPSQWSHQLLDPALPADWHFVRVSPGGKARIATGSHYWDSAWEIVSPVNGATWPAESSQLVSWAGTGTATVEARMNPASSFQTLASNVAADEATVTVPAWVTSNAEVRVSRISPAASASATPINVIVTPPTITSPIGGESWAPGSQQVVTWSGDGPVDITLFADVTSQGTSLTGPSTVLRTGATGNSATVTLPADIATTRARIQLSRTVTGTTYYSFSPSAFKIVTVPNVWTYDAVDTPNHGWNQCDMCWNGANGLDAVWLDYQGGEDLRHASRIDRTLPWVAEVVDSQGAVGSWPSIVRGADGRLHVAYYDHTVDFYGTGGGAYLYYKVRTAAGVWQPRVQVGPYIQVVQGDCSIALDNAGVPVVACNSGNYLGSPNWMKLKVYKQQPDQSWLQFGATIPAESPHHITLKSAPSNVFWVSYIDQGGARLNLWKYSGGAWAVFPAVFASGPYTDVSLALNASSNPQLAYTVPGTAALSQTLVFHPWSAGGGGFAIPAPIDVSLGTISSVSLTYGATYPRLGYIGNGVAKQATGVYSSSQYPCAWTKEAVDGTGNMDSQVTLVVNPSNDERWFLYRDLTAQSLRSARWLDTTPPAASQFLNPSAGCDSIWVEWQSTGDDGNAGVAASFDLRWSSGPITNDTQFNGSSAVPAALPLPGPSGTNHRIAIYMGPCSSHFYFGLKIRDDAGNLSALIGDPWGAQTACVHWPLMCEDAAHEEREPEAAPLVTEITSLRPNPTFASVDVQVALAKADADAAIDLSVFDVAGRRVMTLRHSNPGMGRHAVTWDLHDTTGRRVSAGIYFVRLKVASKTLIQRVVVMR